MLPIFIAIDRCLMLVYRSDRLVAHTSGAYCITAAKIGVIVFNVVLKWITAERAYPLFHTTGEQRFECVSPVECVIDDSLWLYHPF